MTIDELIEAFDMLDDWEERYAIIIDLGRKLPPFPEECRDDLHKVEGCVSQVWMDHTVKNGDGTRIEFIADSDAFIVKGLIGVLLMALSDRTPEEIIETDIEDIFRRLGLEQNLSPNRRNGFFSMVQRMKDIAQANAA